MKHTLKSLSFLISFLAILNYSGYSQATQKVNVTQSIPLKIIKVEKPIYVLNFQQAYDYKTVSVTYQQDGVNLNDVSPTSFAAKIQAEILKDAIGGWELFSMNYVTNVDLPQVKSFELLVFRLPKD